MITDVRERHSSILSFDVKTSRVGPSHDPYSRMMVEVETDDEHLIRYFSCGLAGNWLEVNGVKIYDPQSDGQEYQLVEQWFEALTGVRVDDVLEWYAERWDDSSDVREAERLAGWDPSP